MMATDILVSQRRCLVRKKKHWNELEIRNRKKRNTKIDVKKNMGRKEQRKMCIWNEE